MNLDRYSGGAFFLQTTLIATYQSDRKTLGNRKGTFFAVRKRVERFGDEWAKAGLNLFYLRRRTHKEEERTCNGAKPPVNAKNYPVLSCFTPPRNRVVPLKLRYHEVAQRDESKIKKVQNYINVGQVRLDSCV